MKDIETETAISKLTPEVRAEHDKCISEGLKDEKCTKCNALFLAHHHFVRCSNDSCPMKSGKSFLDLWEQSIDKRLEQLGAKPSPEKYGWEEPTHESQGGWTIEGGEEAYNEALEKWEATNG